MSRDRQTAPNASRRILRSAVYVLLLSALLIGSGTAVAASGTTGVSIRITGLPFIVGAAAQAQAVEVPAASVRMTGTAVVPVGGQAANPMGTSGGNGTAGVGPSVLAPFPVAADESGSDVLVLLSWE